MIHHIKAKLISIIRLLIFLVILNSRLQGQYRFIENKGQWEEKVKYRADIRSGFIYIHQSSFSYAYYDSEAIYHHNLKNQQ